MYSIFKKLLLLWTLFFTSLLLADDGTVYIDITNPRVNESAGTMTFTVSLSEIPIIPLYLSYRTVEGTAEDQKDYIGTKNKEAISLLFGLGISSRDVDIEILNDSIYETTKKFYLDIVRMPLGYASKYDGTGIIDDDDPQSLSLYLHSQTVDEGDGSGNIVHFTAELNQDAPSGGVRVEYETSDGSARAVDDYIAKQGSIFIAEGSRRGYIDIEIVGDTLPEDPINEEFNLNITSVSAGSIEKGEAICTIKDDDTIEVDITSYDADEGNESDHNQLKFKIFLTKDYPLNSDLTINYATENGSNHSATADEDYRAKSGSVVFKKGEIEKFVYVDIIGDNEIEYDEHVRMLITGSDLIIDDESEALILNDDGSFSGFSFGNNNFSIIEGDSGQKFLNFNFMLSKPALAGASFTYDTWDGTAEEKDNDYVYTHGEYNLTVGEEHVSISVPINGDINIENNETFHFGIANLNKLSLAGDDEAIGTIINDDGAYPTMKFSDALVSVVEGNSSTKNLEFVLTFDPPALRASSFEFSIEDIDTNASDYVALTKTTYSFAGGETNATIVVQVKGDTEVEADERFKLKISNEHNFTIDGDRFSTGKIINDDIAEYPFSCSEESFVSFNSEARPTDGDSLFNTLSLSSGELSSTHTLIGVSGVNSIGYNVKDNYIWGYNLNLNRVVRIDSQDQTESYDITHLVSHFYVAADVDSHGILYLFSRGSSTERSTLVRVDLENLMALTPITLNQEINTADMAFNPLDGNLYFIQKGTSILSKISISGTTGTVHPVGDIGIGAVDPIINFFDRDGNFYFNKDTESMYKIDTNNSSTATWFSDLDSQLRNGDGARCANAPVTPPVKIDEPLICDSTMYLSSSIKRGTGDTGRMWLHKINTQTNPFSFDVVDDEGAENRYNALAYSDSGDENTTNFIFGLFRDELLKIGKAGKTMSLGKIDALSTLLSRRQFFAGAIYDGYYYISGPGVEYNKIFKIKLSDKSVEEIILTDAISLLDFSFTPDGKFLHGVVDGGKLVRVELDGGKVNFIGDPHNGYQFDSSFSDKNGRFFANDSKGNGFFEFNLETGEKLFLSDSQRASFNDGANCLKSALIFTDYGDAPSSYGKPSHNIVNGLFLGSEVDHDIEPYYSDNASGDDSNGTDDEDGVTFVDGSDINGSYFELDKIHKLKITASKKGYLNAWIDLNVDGDFKDAGEKVIFEKVLSKGNNVVTFKLPTRAFSGKKSYFRFRFSSTKKLDSVQHANDGEVEDYAIGLGSKVLKGKFNIERTNSSSFKRMTDARNAWYTQVVGNDFDYSLVFYEDDFSAEKNVSNVTVNVELMDMDSNATLYDYKFHIPETVSVNRINITDKVVADDLVSVLATKNARFRVSYGVDTTGGIVQADCVVHPELCTNSRSDYAHDNFAIRPHNFYISVEDSKNEIHQDSITKSKSIMRVASGYDYNLTIVATQYPLDSYVPTLGYNSGVSRNLTFKTVGSCADESNASTAIVFNNGINNDLNFTHENVGDYMLSLEDRLWTEVDSNKTISDCIVGDNSVSETKGNERSGCDINTVSNMYFSFHPYKFKVDFSMHNLPSSTHDDFIYMSDMNSTDNNVSLQFEGNITAMSEDNVTNTNFTKGCVATDMVLVPDVSVLVDDGWLVPSGTPNRIRTANYKHKAREDVQISRMVKFNDEVLSPSHFSHMLNFDAPIEVLSDKFLDENNGTSLLELKYNIQKSMTLPINPVQITLHGLEGYAPMSWSEAEGRVNSNPYIPIGKQDLADVERNFYFAQVAPDRILYPRVNFTVSKVIRTPFNVDIFCNASESHCRQTKLLANTKVESSPRKQDGFYLSVHHNVDADGMVTELSSSPKNVTTTPTPIKFTDGRNGEPLTKFNNCNSPKSVVSITSSPALMYYPNGKLPYYVVECIKKEASDWTGIGQTGNVMDSKSNVEIEGKMDW